MNIRNILLMLRLMKEQLRRLIIQNRLNFKTAITMGGGCPKAWKHKTAEH